MVLQSKDPVLGLPIDEGRFAAIIEIVADEQGEFQGEPDLPDAEDASVRMVAHVLGSDYGDAQCLLSLATSRAVDALVQQHGIDLDDSAAITAMIDEHYEALVTVTFAWLDGAVIALRYADVAHKKALLQLREADESGAVR